MCKILRTANCREKIYENLGLTVLGTPYVGYFRARTFEFSLVSFGALCQISDVKIFKRLLHMYSSHRFHPISTKPYEKHGSQGKYRQLLFW